MSISVEVKGNIERAIRLLKKKIQSDGLHKELKYRRFYEKPSVKKKRKRLAAAVGETNLDARFYKSA